MILIAIAFLLTVGVQAGATTCPGDCDGDGSVTVDELVLGVRIALDDANIAQCPAMDVNMDGSVDVPEIIQAVRAALDGCPASNPTNTVAPTTTPTFGASPTPTAMPSHSATASVTATPSPSPTPSPTSEPPLFTDVTSLAGVSYIQHHLNEPPDCGPLPVRRIPGNEVGPDLLEQVLGCVIEHYTGGAAAGDYDNDGWVDLVVTRLDAPGILFRNRGDGSFEDATAAAHLEIPARGNGVAWSDIDNDGDLDLFVTMTGATRYYLFVNDGAGHFTEQAVARGTALSVDFNRIGTSVSTGDYDNDGWLDLVVSEWRPDVDALGPEPTGTRLLHNRGASQPGYFEDLTEAAGLDGVGFANGFFGDPGYYTFTPSFVDFDQDGWADLALVTDYHASRLFWNNHDGTFSDGTAAAHVGTDESGMGSAFGDYDNDGDLDWFVTSIFCPDMPDAFECSGNRLYRNEGGRVFSDQTDAVNVRNGFWGWAAEFFDFDNDGDLDLLQTDGMYVPVDTFDDPYNVDPLRLWRNDAGVMSEIASAVGLADDNSGKGLLTFDYDRDGDLDVFIVNNAGTPRLFRNDIGNRNGWLRVRVVGHESNRAGLGARVRVTAGGTSQLREIDGGSRYLAQGEAAAYFGFGPSHPTTAEVEITWPKTGRIQVLDEVLTDREIVIEEPPAAVSLSRPAHQSTEHR